MKTYLWGETSPRRSIYSWASLRRLKHCIETLGFCIGWRYWRAQNRCAVSPWLVLQWADRCLEHADLVEAAHGDTRLANQFRRWADELNESYKRFMLAPRGEGTLVEAGCEKEDIISKMAERHK